MIGHDLSMRILYRFHGWLIFARVIALFMFVWPYICPHILCTQLVICLLSHFIHISRRVFGHLEAGRTLRTGSDKWQQRFRVSMLFLSSATVSDINNKNKLTHRLCYKRTSFKPSFEYYKWIINRQERFNIESFRKNMWIFNFSRLYLPRESEFHDCFGQYTSHNLY